MKTATASANRSASGPRAPADKPPRRRGEPDRDAAGSKQDSVARAYARLLASVAETPSGLRLPSERELAAELGISRHSARAAFRRLRDTHNVQRVVGSGSFSHPAEPARAFAAPDVAVLDVLEARHILEPTLAVLATSRATAEDFGRIHDKLQAVLNATDPAEYKRVGYEMWLEIARATRNPLLLAMYRMLLECRASLGWDQLRSMADDAAQRELQRQLAEEIWQALGARDPERARALAAQRTRNMLRAASEIDGTRLAAEYDV